MSLNVYTKSEKNKGKKGENIQQKMHIPYILESNPHPFYSCRGLKGQMRIRIECGLDSRSRAGVWPNDRAGVRAVRTIQGGKNKVRIRFGCGLDSRIYSIYIQPHKHTF
jgi:hypothetical protein